MPKYKVKKKAQAGTVNITGSNRPLTEDDLIYGQNAPYPVDTQASSLNLNTPAGRAIDGTKKGIIDIKDYGDQVYDPTLDAAVSAQELLKRRKKRLTENPLVRDANVLMTGVTGVANLIQNNRLQQDERKQSMMNNQSAYFENMEAEGLNNIPMYTKYGGKSKKQTGGSTPQYSRMNPQQMTEWNQFLDYVKDQGMEGSSDLNSKNKNLGQTLFNQFKKVNPNVSIDYSIVPSVQNEMQLLRTNTQQLLARQNDPNASNVMNGVSAVDGWFGSKTSQFRFPNLTTQTYKNGDLVETTDEGLLNGENAATGQRRITTPKKLNMADPSLPSNVKLPTGANPELIQDSSGRKRWAYADPTSGDMVDIRQAGGKTKWSTGRKLQAGGDIPVVKGVDPEMEQFANVEAEAGEVFQMQDGQMGKVSDYGNTHEQGGEMLPNVDRVLEDTSDKRKDKASKALRIQPSEIKEMLGIKTNKSISHAKAFELAAGKIEKREKKYERARKDSALNPEISALSNRTLQINSMNERGEPTTQDAFDLIFDHQEQIKDMIGIQDDGKMAKKGGKYMPRAQAGMQISSNVAKDLKTPKGNLNAVNFPGGVPAYVKSWSALIPEIADVKDAATAQRMTYDYLMKNDPDLIDSQIWGEGLNRMGIEAVKKGANPALNDVVKRAFDDQYRVKPGYSFTPEDRTTLGSVYPDNYLYNRLVVPEQLTKTETDYPKTTPIQPQGTPQRSPLNPSVDLNRPKVKQPDNDFYEPTYWSDIATPMMSLADSMVRDPELYNPTEAHQLRLKLLDPTATLNANQADFNALTDNVDASSGVGASNLANLSAQKYRANNQVLSQYDNQNKQTKNQEIVYNTGVRDHQSVADAQARGQYYHNVQLARDNQRLQRLKSLEDLARVDQMKRRQNNSGNLLMKLSPAYDQQGDYNGYQYVPVLSPELGIANTLYQPTPGAEPSRTRTSTETRYRTSDGRIVKTKTSS